MLLPGDMLTFKYHGETELVISHAGNRMTTLRIFTNGLLVQTFDLVTPFLNLHWRVNSLIHCCNNKRLAMKQNED